MENAVQLDAIDRRILRALQADGRMTYDVLAAQVSLSPSAVSSVGGSQPHTNFQPYLCVDFIISLFGIFPPPS